MPAYSAHALVLRRTKLGETDSIVTFLAEDGRQIRAVAKGLRKPTSKFGGRLEPGAEVDLLAHTGRNLDIVAEARTMDSHAAVREDFDRASAAAVAEDVLDALTRDGEPDPRLFGLARATLSAVETVDVEHLPDVVVAFLLKAMAMHGCRPELDACVVCAGDAGESDLFSLPAGGAICSTCGLDEAGIMRLSRAGREWLGRLLSAKMADVASLGVPHAAVLHCFEVVRAFVAYHLPARLKALDFYATTMPHESDPEHVA